MAVSVIVLPACDFAGNASRGFMHDCNHVAEQRLGPASRSSETFRCATGMDISNLTEE